MKIYNIVGFGYKNGTVPDLFTCRILCDKMSYDNGIHLIIASENAFENHGYSNNNDSDMHRGLVMCDHTDILYYHMDFENKIDWNMVKIIEI